jgi:hypothetical protein
MTDRDLFRQIREAVARQQFARQAGMLREPDDADLDLGRMQLSDRLRRAIAAWLARRPSADDVELWRDVMADELMFLAAELFCLAHVETPPGAFDFEVNQFLGTLHSAIDECRGRLPEILAQR